MVVSRFRGGQEPATCKSARLGEIISVSCLLHFPCLCILVTFGVGTILLIETIDFVPQHVRSDAASRRITIHCIR